MLRLFETSIGRLLIDLPERRFKPASFAVFDGSGEQIAGGKWAARQQIAWALTNLGDVPKAEAAAIERALLSAWQGGRFAKPSDPAAKVG